MAEQATINPSTVSSLDDATKMFVTLVSMDDYEFHIKLEYAIKSTTIKDMIESQGFFMTQKPKIKFEQIPGYILEKVCEYLIYRHHYASKSVDFIPEFPVNKENALDLLIAANFLDC